MCLLHLHSSYTVVVRVSSNSTVNDRDDNSDDNGDDNGNDAIKWLWFNENCILRALHK